MEKGCISHSSVGEINCDISQQPSDKGYENGTTEVLGDKKAASRRIVPY